MWILLLAVLPFTGMGPLPCLTLATLLTAVAVVVAERRRTRRLRAVDAPAGGPGRGERRPMSAPTAVGLTLGAVALLAYVLFVIRAA